MTRGTTQDATERQGIHLTGGAFESIGMAFREQTVRDFGIDAHAEVLDEALAATGSLLALQVKTGPSFFKEPTQDGFVFRFDQEHRDYWIGHSLPVVVVLVDLGARVLNWERIAENTLVGTGKGWKVVVPRSQRVDEASAELLQKAATKLPAASSFSIAKEEDLSHGLAKRYAVHVVLNRTSTKAEIAAIVREVTLQQMASRYYRSKRVQARWGNSTAQVVWVTVYTSYDDYKNSNAVCNGLWIDSELPENARPIDSGGENIGMSISVRWSENWRALADMLVSSTVSKEEFLREHDSLIHLLRAEVSEGRAQIELHESDQISLSDLDVRMVPIAQRLESLHERATELGVSPLECRDLEVRFQAAASYAHNLSLPFLDSGKDMWDRPTALHLAKSAIANFDNELQRLEFEREKV